MEEGIEETINTKDFYGQGTELLNSSLTKREEMSAILCLGMNWNLLREEAGNWPECRQVQFYVETLAGNAEKQKWGNEDHR